MSAVHPEEVTPEGVDLTTDLSPADLVKQEKFLFQKYLEFEDSEVLSPLLEFSA